MKTQMVKNDVVCGFLLSPLNPLGAAMIDAGERGEIEVCATANIMPIAAGQMVTAFLIRRTASVYENPRYVVGVGPYHEGDIAILDRIQDGKYYNGNLPEVDRLLSEVSYGLDPEKVEALRKAQGIYQEAINGCGLGMEKFWAELYEFYGIPSGTAIGSMLKRVACSIAGPENMYDLVMTFEKLLPLYVAAGGVIRLVPGESPIAS